MSLNYLLDPPQATHPPNFSDSFDDFVTLDISSSSSSSTSSSDSSSDSDADTMPPSTRRVVRRHSVVDLTESPDPPPTRRRKRSTEDAGPAPRKKGKRALSEVDLTDENPSAEEELKQEQHEATIRAQRAEVDAGPKRLGALQCIICMEAYTDGTTTACGHFYCHECLHQSLLVGERSEEKKGSCPVCRKVINRKSKRVEIIPISFMKREVFKTMGQSPTA